MKTIEIKKTGNPEVLEIKDVKLDEPKSEEVLIKQTAIGLNYIDTYHRSGLYPVPLPSGIGLEGAGIIEKVGPNTKNFKEGDKVAYAAAPIGSYCTHRIYPTKSLVKVPDGIDLEVVASIMTKGITTFYLLHKSYVVQSGQTILFHAAAGGVGQIFCQWAKSLGCNVIGTVGSDEKIEIAKKYGCSEVINYSKNDFQKEVMKISNNEGLPVVYDGVGKVTMEKSLMCLKMRGTFVSFGNASGKLDPVDVGKLIAPKGLFLTRPSIAHYTSTREELDEAANMLFEMIKSKKVQIEIFKKYSLKDVVHAHKDLEARKIIGPAIILPN
ncbi:MAG: quinone oxidoreductase family protein [Candidatus Pelagibacter sp.]|tara:strand:- start:1086 stop:2060 length:975 start_codon:yes stop_codon:yes gene_type:complete